MNEPLTPDIKDETVDECNTDAPCTDVETIRFCVTAEHIKEHMKLTSQALDVIAVCISLLAGFLVAIDHFFAGIAVAILSFAVCKMFFTIRTNKQAQKLIEKANNSTAEYILKENFIEYYGYENSELVHFRRIKFEDIITVKQTPTALNFVADGISYFIPTDSLKESSKFVTKLSETKNIKVSKGQKAPERGKDAIKEAKKHALASATLALSIASAVVCALLVLFDEYIPFSWIPLCALILPIAYFVMYAVTKRKKIDTNGLCTFVAVASIFVMLNTITVISGNVAYKENERMAHDISAEFTDITHRMLPPTDTAHYYTTEKYAEFCEKFVKTETATFYFDENEPDIRESFQKSILEDTAWISPKSEAFQSYGDFFDGYEYYDKVMIYNAVSGGYNELISASNAKYYIVAYSAQNNMIEIHKIAIE